MILEIAGEMAMAITLIASLTCKRGKVVAPVEIANEMAMATTLIATPTCKRGKVVAPSHSMTPAM
jgi:hypothetical protein